MSATATALYILLYAILLIWGTAILVVVGTRYDQYWWTPPTILSALLTWIVADAYLVTLLVSVFSY